MIDLAILGLLTEQELHGYELKKRLGELLSEPRVDQLRLALPGPRPPRGPGRRQGRRAAHLGAVGADVGLPRRRAGRVQGPRPRERPREGTGRGKKVYGITDVGRERLVELLSDPDVSDDRAFTLRVAFARHLDPAARLEVFERRRTELLGRRDDLKRRRTGRRADAYLGALLERDADHLANDLAWLDRLIETERNRSKPSMEETS